MTTLDCALAALTCDLCLQIGNDFAKCTSVIQSGIESGIESGMESGISGLDPETECTTNSSNPDAISRFSTWLCKDSLFFTLIKTEGPTLVFSHSNGVLYYATPAAQLGHNCPAGTAFLCQFTVDILPEGQTQRLLVFDIISNDPSPESRGSHMRALAIHLPQPLCCPQWVGPRRSLTREFMLGLPHTVSGVFSIGENPLVLGALEKI